MKVEIKTLEELRRFKNISFHDMEKVISKQTYYNVIRKNFVTREDVWIKLEKIFGIPKSELVKLVK